MTLIQTNQISTSLLQIYNFLRDKWRELPREVPSETTSLINIIINRGLFNNDIDLDPKSGPTTKGISILFFLLQRYYADFHSHFQKNTKVCIVDVGTGFEVLPLLALTILSQETGTPFHMIVCEKSSQARSLLEQQITMLKLPEVTLFRKLSDNTIEDLKLLLKTKIESQTRVAITATNIEVYPHQQTSFGTMPGSPKDSTRLEPPLPLNLLRLAEDIRQTGIVPDLILRASSPKEALELRELLAQQRITNLTIKSYNFKPTGKINTAPYSPEYMTEVTGKNERPSLFYMLSRLRYDKENLVRASLPKSGLTHTIDKPSGF